MHAKAAVTVAIAVDAAAVAVAMAAVTASAEKAVVNAVIAVKAAIATTAAIVAKAAAVVRIAPSALRAKTQRAPTTWTPHAAKSAHRVNATTTGAKHVATTVAMVAVARAPSASLDARNRWSTALPENRCNRTLSSIPCPARMRRKVETRHKASARVVAATAAAGVVVAIVMRPLQQPARTAPLPQRKALKALWPQMAIKRATRRQMAKPPRTVKAARAAAGVAVVIATAVSATQKARRLKA